MLERYSNFYLVVGFFLYSVEYEVTTGFKINVNMILNSKRILVFLALFGFQR